MNNNIFSLLKLISEYKKEIKSIDPSCKVSFSFSSENNGEYDKENNKIKISLARMGKNIFSLNLSDKILSEISFTCFHERRHLLDFKFSNAEKSTETILLEKLAFQNKRHLYKDRFYGEIWYEQRAICDGYISGEKFIKKLFPNIDTKTIIKEHIDKLSESKYIHTQKTRYPFLENIKNLNIQETFRFLNERFENEPTEPFSSISNNYGGYISLYSVFYFALPTKFIFLKDEKLAEEQIKRFSNLETKDYYIDSQKNFNSLTRKEQLLSLLNLDLNSYKFVSDIVPDFLNTEKMLLSFCNEKTISEDTVKKLNIAPEPPISDLF